MSSRRVKSQLAITLGSLALLLALAAVACQSTPETTESAESPDIFNEGNNGVTVSGGEGWHASAMDLFSGSGDVMFSAGPAATVENVLEKGLRLAGASPTHLAVRGTPSAATIRCDWRGVARNTDQRELAIRYWLGLDTDDSIPEISYLEVLFNASLDVTRPQFLYTAKSNFRAIAQGGLSTDYLFLTCFADYSASEYILGAGPTSLTLGYDRMGEAHSYPLYLKEYNYGSFGNDPLLSEGEYQNYLDEIVRRAESYLNDAIGGRESVLFLAPMAAHNAIAIEAWQVIEQWDLQSEDHDDDDATDPVIYAVRYGTSEGDSEHKQTLANLKSRITTAASSDDFATTRIANVSGLTQYYRDMGAYGDITPDDGSTATFAPSQPPPALSCAIGTAIASPADNRALVHDCQALLNAKDSLRGTGLLNWSTGTAISGWDGITTGGTPTRVTKVELDSESLNGIIPEELGSLFELTHLKLNSNSLTGSIPHELGWLYNLEELKLSGNSLTGCIPIALEGVATNDLSSLNLLYCQPPAPSAPTPGTVEATTVPLSWTAVANTSRYRVEYRETLPIDWTVDSETVTTTTHTIDELICEAPYQFRVSAYGSGTTYAAAWSDPSAIVAATTGECPPPASGAFSFFFGEERGEPKWKLEPLYIPDKDTHEWLRTHPLEQYRWTTDKNRRTNGHYVNIVRLIKWWWQTAYPNLEYPKSYPLEHLVGDSCPDEFGSLAEGFTIVLEQLHSTFSAIAVGGVVPFTPDRGVPEHNVLKRLTPEDFSTFLECVQEASVVARQALDSDDPSTSAALWKSLLGKRFPSPPNSPSSSGSKGDRGESGGFTPRTGPTTIGGGRFA